MTGDRPPARTRMSGRRKVAYVLLAEEFLVAVWRSHQRETRWWEDVWTWLVYQVVSGYPPGELDHWGPMFAAVETNRKGSTAAPEMAESGG